MYVHRTLEPAVAAAAAEFPVVVLTGPRQAGKTTLLRRMMGSEVPYVSLDLPDVRAAAQVDPRGFLAAYGHPLILDEVQNAPDLLHYIRAEVDDRRDDPGQYILGGSQNLQLSQHVTESLAGRAAVLRLLPLSLREAVGLPRALMPWDCDTTPGRCRVEPELTFTKLWERLVRGLYPELVARSVNSARWHSGYIQTYLERDVRSVRQVGDLASFHVFLRALAARTAQLLNLSELCRDVGVSTSTGRAWLSVLEASHQVVILRPYHRSMGKRLVKSPRVYFIDVGTVCHLCGITTVDQATQGPMAGALFETAVVSEAFKAAHGQGEAPRLSFWRTADGAEVDLVGERSGRLVPIEIKSSATPRPAMATGIARFRDTFAGEAERGYVVHPGDAVMPLGANVTAVPLGLVGSSP